MAAHDGTLIEESYNLLNAWLSIVPGNSRAQLAPAGTPRDELRRSELPLRSRSGTAGPARTWDVRRWRCSKRRYQTPYFFNLHVQDVGHTVVLGATGSGKSFLLNFLTLHAQQYDPLTVIFDLGHSYRTLAARVQGSYLQLGLRPRDVPINPFAFDPTPEHLNFLQIFVRVLLEGADAVPAVGC